ncbi:cytochrome P450 CYP5313 [Phycomyces blakesleeanus NRRL 1555(-)]|uniref:Cytochrome P450 CYP5313 n=1 Tax=Phycomyces blakesleeanus (strain ATCC 8743b / DSM 1359 / FGSC 10004 / NBRC 33097 / NRRL 1555) TaxID=763407 RepID=A0A162PT84_PHYB8|nr:cytochrome P450 CYP5313 [Phycomyces blakesleeanus NRRL 1555(-)]OAD75767.1 cytochrome P450 CYP5313 [Phycomyces blakesleeanus NRRL 1555(-)]|eukprot:XP_018293807.1 cytochrome P450 CYP5313 [Phycomyces blakesleeanus NRRL 1555(-)]
MNHIEAFSKYFIFTFPENINFTQVGKIAATGLKIQSAFFSPLGDIPGPFSKRFFEGSYFSKKKPGKRDYHNKYGHLVRIGPSKISVSDKDIIKQIMVTEDFEKSSIYSKMKGKDEWNTFNMIDKDTHKQRRRLVSSAFSIKYIKSLEPLFESVTESFVKRINLDTERTKEGDEFGVIDIWQLLRCLTLDVIGETAFGGTFNMLENDDHAVSRAIVKLTRGVEFVFYTSPLADKFVSNIISERTHSKEKRNDILQILVDTQHAKNTKDRMNSRQIASETGLFLIAGSETTSNTIGFALIEMCRNTDVLTELYAEIDKVDLDEGRILFHQEQIKNLPYLNAVIKETMRLNHVASMGLERMVTHDIIIKENIVVPKGTHVRCCLHVAQIHPDYWPEPLTFNPNRWLKNADPEPCTDAFFPFSLGSRNCIGKDFSMNEMRLVLATLIKNYEIKPISEQMKASEEKHHFLTLTIESGSFKVRMKPRAT